MTKNLCAPQNVYGSFDQTLFLGCSVLSFNASAGLNEQSSELTVDLVKDPCITAKKYIPTNVPDFTVTTAILADPGFTEPVLGSPVYFRVANFEYAGIFQSWTQKNDAGGNPVFTVKLTDPRMLLDNIQLIVGEYQGKINGLRSVLDWQNDQPSTDPSRQLGNIVNVFGFLDSLSANCPLLQAGGTTFGAPAGGWGVAEPNSNGIPWNLVKSAVQVLLGNNSGSTNPNFSKGFVLGPPGGNNGYGEIYTGGPPYSSVANPAKYILDLSEIPFAPPHYRISGPIISASELISQVCRDAGCDYYIELLPTAGALVIKVRVIVRSNQPAMGEISTFVNAAGNAGRVSNYTIGREYRSDPNNAFIIGDNVRSVYQTSGGGVPTGVELQIMPYWGRDLDGKLISGYEDTCEVSDPAVSPNWLGPPDWNVRLDIREINNLLYLPFSDAPQAKTKTLGGFGWVWEGTLRAAMGNFKTFVAFVMQPHPYCEYTPSMDDFVRLYFEDCNVALQNAPGVANKPTDATGPEGASQLLRAINATVGTRGPTGPGSRQLQDMRTVHKWLQKYAQEYYGRKWLVEIPFACYAGQSGNPASITWSDQPSPEGGWTDEPSVLELINNPLAANVAIDRFKSEDGRMLPMLRWTQNAPNASANRNPSMTGLKFDNIPISRVATNTFDDQPDQGPDLYVWQKAQLDEKWVTGCPYLGADQNRVFALLTCDPVYTGIPLGEGTRPADMLIVKSGLRDKVAANLTDPNNLTGAIGSGMAFSMLQVAGQFSDRMLPPKAAAVPVLSNTQTYGPWYKEGITHGTVYAEHDQGLNPWTYGGSSFMTLAALTKVETSTTQMNFAERGEVTLAGYPTQPLGASMTSTTKLYSDRTLNSASFEGFVYNFVPLASNETAASVSNINVVVSPQGVTTSYDISTFTPIFGRFSKDNAERIKEIGQLKLRTERANRRSRGKELLAGMDDLGSRERVLLSSLVAGPEVAQQSPGVLLAGHLSSFNRKRKEVIVGDQHTFAYFSGYPTTAMMSFDGLLRPVAKGSGAYRANLPTMKQGSEYNDLLCPSTGTKYETETTGAYSGFNTGELEYKNLKMPIAPPPPVNLMSGIIISANYLDPLADPISNAVFTNDKRSIGAFGTGIGSGYVPIPTGTGGNPLITHASGHDIESVARGDLQGLTDLQGNAGSSISGESMLIAGESGRYSGDYRFMALRGPLIMHSWGYDTYGKPIPNSRGYSGDASFQTGAGGGWDTTIVADTGNSHQKSQSGLTDRFAPNWLSDATNWPVAPVDLRFDRARGVWTTPPPFRLMRAQAIQDIDAGKTGMVEILNGDDMFDHNGKTWSGIEVVSGTGTGGDIVYTVGAPPLVNIENFGASKIEKDETFGLYYDTHSCSYWTLGMAGGGGGGCEDGITAIIGYVVNFRCVGDIIESCHGVMEFEKGCLVGVNTGDCGE
jgi:hypothetical protein